MRSSTRWSGVSGGPYRPGREETAPAHRPRPAEPYDGGEWPAMMRPMFSGLKNSGMGSVPAWTLTKSSMACWLPATAPSSCCVSGGGGWSSLGEVERHLVHRHHVFVARRLVGGHGVVVGAALGERGVEGVGEPLGVEERVGDALGGDRVQVVAGVADEGPARSVRLAEVAGEVARGVEALLARRPDRTRSPSAGSSVERSEEGAFDVAAGGVERVLRHTDDDEGEVVMGRERGHAERSPHEDLEAGAADAAPVRVERGRHGRLLVVLLRAHRLGDCGVAAVGADDDLGALGHRVPPASLPRIPTTVPSSMRTSSTENPSRTSTPASAAAWTSIVSSTCGAGSRPRRCRRWAAASRRS